MLKWFRKKNIADFNVLESIGKEIGLGPEFGKRLRSGEKVGEAQNALEMAKKVGINETPTIVIAGNIKTDPHAMDHKLDLFRDNIIVILKSIFKAK
jgi:predicted DsbA family dithiol-disulfide isomerase